MKPEACLEVADRSRKQAEAYLRKGNVGRAFAHFLVALKLCPSWKAELSQHFTSALCLWGETLDQQQRYKDLFSCYEQALEVLPDSEEVLNSLGTHLYRWGHVSEACSYFRRAVACNPGFLPARRNFQGSCNLLVERWHFRMLNDIVRNDAYRAAIIRRVLQQGADASVLDIGAGTGILSLFAVEAGAGQVFACDCSSTMIQIASDVLHANGAADKVTLINKLSTDVIIPVDMPARVSLVVTETVDAGLLGEGILQSLIHAWDHLLLPPGSKNQMENVGRVVPAAAGVWVVPIECIHIAKKYRLLNPDMTQQDLSNVLQAQKESSSVEHPVQEVCNKMKEFDLSELRLVAKHDEPYDTEDLNTVPDGYRFLTSPCHALHIKFNDRQDLADWLHGQKGVEQCLTCVQSGRVDAIAMWFDLHLDGITILSSAPDDVSDRDGVHRANCWDQAIFPLQTPIHITSGQKLNISVTCHGGKISVEVHNQNRIEDIRTISKLQDSFSSSKIPTVLNESQASKELHNDDKESPENFSGNIESDTESSEHLALNISADCESDMPCGNVTAPNVSSGENYVCSHEDKEKEAVLKDKRAQYEVTLREPMSHKLGFLKSHGSSNEMLYKVPESVVVCGNSVRLDCSYIVSQPIVQFLNDEQWMKALKKAALLLCQQLNRYISAVLDISPFPVFGLLLLMSCSARLICVVSSSSDESAIQHFAKLHGIATTQLQCVTDKQLMEMLDSGVAQFDIIMAPLVDPSGELKETTFNMIPALSGKFKPWLQFVLMWLNEVYAIEGSPFLLGMEKPWVRYKYHSLSQHEEKDLKAVWDNLGTAGKSSLAEGGTFLPQEICVMGKLLQSDWLMQVSHVLNNSRTCGYDIARFINTYQVSQHLDLNLSTLATAILSNPVELLKLSLKRTTFEMTQTTDATATCPGMVNAIAYWYNIHFYDDIPAVCTAKPSSHVNQAAILLQPHVPVCDGKIVKLLVRFHQGLLHVEPLQEAGVAT